MIDKLKKEEKEVQDLIKEWEKYETSEKKHYNIPFPHEIKEMRINRIPLYKGWKGVEELKEILSYFNVVCDYYNNNDYIVNHEYCTGNFKEKTDINHVKITEDHRKMIQEICDYLKHKIKKNELMFGE